MADRVTATLSRWHFEALSFCCGHGRAGGVFEARRWANGSVMATAIMPGGKACLPSQCIPVEELNELRRNGWTFSTPD